MATDHRFPGRTKDDMNPANGRADNRGEQASAHERSADASGSTWLLPLLLLGAVLATISFNARAALYKWTDERGITHYSDKLPIEAVNRASSELSREGITVRKTEPMKPVARIAPKVQDDEQQRLRLAERERQLAERRDRALLESYTNEAEIDLAKSRAVATLDGQAQSAEAFISQMNKRRAELEAKKVTYAPRPVPGSLEREIETIDSEVAHQNEFIAAKHKEAAGVAARYDSDKQRFRELRGIAPTGGVVTTEDGRYAENAPTAIEPTKATK
jgi:uncharacterized protein DUF4124